jgi:nitrile hydratase subunit alpha
LSHHDDIELHVRAVEEDLEYWRTKRFEPRVFRLLRKNQLTFFEIIESSDDARPRLAILKSNGSLEERLVALELALGKYIRAIEVATSIIGKLVLVEESREDAGIYDPRLKFAHRTLSGSLEERVSQLERMLYEDMVLVHSVLISLTEKGLVSSVRLKEMLDAENPPRYENGARIVAKAWLDPEFKSRLLNDGKATLRELGFALNRTPKLVVLEDTKTVRNVIVCTLCSCYPYELLGNPPWWYKHDSYKEAIVKHPRKTLKEMFNLVVPKDVEVRVSDSTSDIRYMVLPVRPKDTEGLSEDLLSKLVTAEDLIGVGKATKPVIMSASEA